MSRIRVTGEGKRHHPCIIQCERQNYGGIRITNKKTGICFRFWKLQAQQPGTVVPLEIFLEILKRADPD